jgi:hypothetical protein
MQTHYYVVIANKHVPMAMKQHTTGKLLQVAFSVVRAAAVAMQWHNKHVSAATVELQQ